MSRTLTTGFFFFRDDLDFARIFYFTSFLHLEQSSVPPMIGFRQPIFRRVRNSPSNNAVRSNSSVRIDRANVLSGAALFAPSVRGAVWLDGRHCKRG